MKKALILIILVAAVLGGYYLFFQHDSFAKDNATDQVAGTPAKGLVTMIDLGADRCIPCKMMAPIIEEVRAEYKGRAEVIFIDVWKDSKPAKQYGIRVIPTQIFFDRDGKEVYRHEGFLPKEAIVEIFARIGVK